MEQGYSYDLEDRGFAGSQPKEEADPFVFSEKKGKAVLKKEERLNRKRFYQGNKALLRSVRQKFLEAEDFYEFLELRGPLLKLLRDAVERDVKWPRMVFRCIVSRDYAARRKQELFSMESSKGVYKPCDHGFDGGDSWIVLEYGNRKVGLVIDTYGHGRGYARQKLFVEKAFFLLERLPDKEREAGIDSLNRFFAEIFHLEAELFSNLIRAEISYTENGSRFLTVDVYGDTGMLIYDCVNRQVEEFNLPDIPPKENRFFRKLRIGFARTLGITPQAIKPETFRRQLSSYEHVILFSDGLGRLQDSHNRTVSHILEELCKQPECGYNISEQIRGFVNDSKAKDDITVLIMA